jgi:nickel-dependent lactate racemase
MKTTIPWGEDGRLEFELPPGWKLSGVVEPAGRGRVPDISEELASGLAKPIGAPPLADLCRGKNSVAVVVDDISRPTPAHLFIGDLLGALTGAGIDEERITLVTATGTHRAMTAEEMETKVGGEVAGRYGWVNHDCRDDRQLASLGRTSLGTPVRINRLVADADLVLLVGTIEPHPHAGFGGGYKNILPGVAGVDTVGRNHLLSAKPGNFSMVGWEPEKNPMRLDLEEAGRMLRPPCFMVNTVLSPELEVVRIVAGDPVEAHREGMTTARSLYGVEIEERADVVITSSHPMDHDLRQGVKAVANTFMAAKEGGLVIAAMRCLSGKGDMEVPKLRVPDSPRLIRMGALALLPVVKYAPGIPVEERFYMYTALRTVLRNRLRVFAPEIPEEIRGRLGSFCSLVPFQEMIEEAARSMPRASVLVFPRGGVTYPIVRSEADRNGTAGANS